MRVTEKPRGLLRKSKLDFQRIVQVEDIIYSAGQDNRLLLCTLLLFKNVCKPKHNYMG